jgi:hypothetical protein
MPESIIVFYFFEEVNLELNVIAVMREAKKVAGSQSCKTASYNSNFDNSGHRK